MKNWLSVALVALLLSLSVYGQSDDRKVKDILAQYQKVKAEIQKIETDKEAGMQSPLAVNELVVNKFNKSWPAVGTYSVVYRFYYRQFGEEPYPDTLVLLTKKTVSAAREYQEEFLLGENGSLVLIRQIDAAGNDHRGYFEGERMFRYVGKGEKKNISTLKKSVNDYYRLFALSIQQ